MFGFSRIAVLFLVLAVPVAIANCTNLAYGVMNATASLGGYQRHSDISFGTGPRQKLDVFVPNGAHNRPVVVFWYGGMWTKGSKSSYRFVGAALANAGYVAVLPDYRLFPDAQFPAFIEDGAWAVRWTHEHAARFGGNSQAIFLMSHSAGAHLAATVALDGRYLSRVEGDVNWVRGLIGLSGPYAFEPRNRILEQIFRQPYSHLDWQPIQLVSQRAPPTLLLHGSDDWMVAPKEMLDLDKKLRAAGILVESHLYDGRTHWDTVAALSIPGRMLAPTIADVSRFIDRVAVGSRDSPVSQSPRLPAARVAPIALKD